jgi:hypothetical protein
MEAGIYSEILVNIYTEPQGVTFQKTVISTIQTVYTELCVQNDRIPMGARFFAPVQTDPGAHPASYTMGYQFSFPGVEWPGRGVDHPPPPSA